MDKVTIVTVTYNAEASIEETILSVIHQSYENIEYIVIDGASTDATVDIIKQYEEKIDYWVSEPDGGIYYAMNKAIEKATGEWINFMNAGDTFADLDTVAYVMAHKNANAELIYGNYRVKGSRKIKRALPQSEWFHTMPFCHQTLFTKTEIMKQELFDTCFELAADHNFIIKMYRQQKQFLYIDRLVAIFAPGGFATTNQMLMSVESIKVLLKNDAPISEIRQSAWYKNLQTRSVFYRGLMTVLNLVIKKLYRIYYGTDELSNPSKS